MAHQPSNDDEQQEDDASEPFSKKRKRHDELHAGSFLDPNATKREKHAVLDPILEHLSIVGHHARYQQWRMNRFEYKPDATVVHAQDCRIYNGQDSRYEKNGCLPPNWPLPFLGGPRMTVPSDTTFDKECGDGIHPILFSKLRLSQQTSSNDFPKLLQATHKSDSVLVSEGDVPYAMVQDCWRRAVEIATSTLSVKAPATVSATSTASSSSNSASKEEDPSPVVRRTPQQARIACAALRLPVPNIPAQEKKDNDRPWYCCSCKQHVSQFETHFFGTETTLGCGWGAIAHARQRIIVQVLTRVADTQMQSLLQLMIQEIASEAKTRTTKTTTTVQPLDAFDVVNLLRRHWDTSRPVHTTTTATRGLLFSTLQVRPRQPPLVLNAAVLESVRRRVIDRYGMIPR